MNTSEQHRHECEARHILKMSDDHRQEYYKGVQSKRGLKATEGLVGEVKRRLELEAQKALGMDDFSRQAYYHKVSDERGDKGINELLAEVKRQRRLSKGLER